jgi:hypothetical protein
MFLGGPWTNKCGFVFMPIWNIIRPLGIDIVHMAVWYIFYRFGMFDRDKSGNPADEQSQAGNDGKVEISPIKGETET